MEKQQERTIARQMVEEIARLSKHHDGRLRFMEVCGTHTVSIFRAGIRQLLPDNIELVSGPGCPVCVTPDTYIDKSVAYAEREDVIITTFGDMLKVPGSSSSLGEAQADGADIRILYSPMDSLQIARENPDKKVIFLAVGFETTAPTAAATVLAAKQQGIRNLFMLSAHKLVPPALRMLLDDPEVHVDGFLLPGHVAVVTGTEVFNFLSEEYHIPGIVTGFEPLEILRSLVRLMQQKIDGRSEVRNEYGSVVRKEGNPVELAKVKDDFDAARNRHEFIFAEGSGGIICPIRYDSDTAANVDDIAKVVPQKIFLVDIIKALNLPILVVTTAALGSINACVLTVEYARSRGIKVHGLIVNRHGMSKNFEMEDDNIKMMQDLTGLPVFAKISEGDNDLGVDKTF